MFKNLSFKNVLQFLVLAVGANAIFYVLFSRSSYYPAFIEAFTMTHEQFGVMFAVYGWVATATYFLGGIVADKVSSRLLLSLSLALTGLLNIWYGTFPGYKVGVFLYGMMGITTTLLFWSAHLKATRQLGRNIKSESKAFGALQAGHGITGVVLGTFAAFMYNQFAVITQGLRFVMFFYGGVLILLGVIAYFVFDESIDKEEIRSQENPFKLLLETIKNPDAWIATFMAAGGYTIGSVIGSYFGTMSQMNYGVAAGTLAYIGLLSQYFRPVGGLAAGWFGERFSPTKTILILNVILTGFAILIAFLPTGPNYLYLFLVVIVLEIIFTGAYRSHKYATIKDARIPMTLSGSAIGLIATMTYASDAFLPPIIGRLLDTYDSVLAFRYIMFIMVGFGVLGILMSTWYWIRNKKNITEMLAEEKQARGIPVSAK